MQELLQYRKEVLIGEKINLRVTTKEDEELFAKWWNEDTILLGNRNRIIPTFEEDNAPLFHNWSANQNSNGFALTIENKECVAVGHVSVFGLSLPMMIATIGIFVGSEYRGHGYGKEAMQKAIRICFEELNVHKVELNVYSYNEAAIAMYKKVGFVHEGTRRAASYHHGKYYDVYTMGILREEYLG
ncbi:MAG: GNAT family N-acetyltransferase [Erysipelotrichaceae bacterium]|nr:GNAT family N-acetyltransferase [Erysipelotrichaceae bacterium]MDY6035326.1 GNAT family protein [Bulleidia sp.]